MINDLKDFKYLKRISNNEYSAACPQCGGERHQNGEYPDRVRIWMKSRTYGGMLGWCRKCGYIWSPKKDIWKDSAMHQRWIEERKAMEEEKKIRIEKTIELLKVEQTWVKYHENLSVELRQLYYKRGIIDYFIDYWMLGYNPETHYWANKQEYISPALTIPIMAVGGDVVNIRNRLLEPIDNSDKYRPEIYNLPANLFLTDYEKQPTGKAFIVEGEFKAMTTYIELDDPDIYMIGIPGVTPSEDLMHILDNCEPVYICLDPDAAFPPKAGGKSPLLRMIEIFADRARVISLPDKIDDMIQRKELNKDDIKSLMRFARRYQIKNKEY